ELQERRIEDSNIKHLEHGLEFNAAHPLFSKDEREKNKDRINQFLEVLISGKLNTKSKEITDDDIKEAKKRFQKINYWFGAFDFNIGEKTQELNRKELEEGFQTDSTYTRFEKNQLVNPYISEEEFPFGMDGDFIRMPVQTALTCNFVSQEDVDKFFLDKLEQEKNPKAKHIVAEKPSEVIKPGDLIKKPKEEKRSKPVLKLKGNIVPEESQPILLKPKRRVKLEKSKKEEKPKEKEMLEVSKEEPSKSNLFKKIALGTVLTTAIFGLANLNYKKIYQDFTRKEIVQKENLEQFPYEFSPFLRYSKLENKLLDELNVSKKIVPRSNNKIEAFADEYAKQVALEIMNLTKEDHYTGARLISKDKYMNLLAKELRKFEPRVFYGEESLLSNSVNNNSNRIHLDCDLITYLFLHASMKCDVPMYAISSRRHVYLIVKQNKNSRGCYVIEPTEFRKMLPIHDSDGNVVGYDVYSSDDLGSRFFSSYKEQMEKINSDGRFEKTNEFHIPVIGESKLESLMIANIIEGIQDKAESSKDEELLNKIYEKKKKLLTLKNANYILASNFHEDSIIYAEKQIKKRDYDLAHKYLDDAYRTEEKFEEFLVFSDPISEIKRGKLLNLQKNYAKAQDTLEGAIKFYELREEKYHKLFDYGCPLVNDGSRCAQNASHAEALIYLAEAKLKQNISNYEKLKVAEEILNPAINTFNMWLDFKSHSDLVKKVEEVVNLYENN
ncbi:hypothetical protein KY321_04310, partial [Candidatus Woesearchaeota archaeon]|nr:hypothetical protein [Candidatus Woesearchaeota archaeon]